jgi:hypothetical protein
MRYNEITEARRGGDRNPRTSASDIVKVLQYYSSLRGNEYYYISYTMLDKLGINPRSGYNTPIGIYSYPLNDAMVSDIERSGLKAGVPYMGESPYIWLFRPKNNTNGLVIGEYDTANFNSDRDKLFEFVNDRDKRINDDVFDKIVSFSIRDAKNQSSSGYIWNLTRILAKILTGSSSLSVYTGNLLKINDRIRYKGKTGVITDIYDSEEYEVEFLDTENNVIDSIVISVDDPDITVVSDTTKNEYAKALSGLKFAIGNLAVLNNPNATPRYRIIDVDFEKGGVILKHINNKKSEFFWPFHRLYKGNPQYAPDTNESIIVEYKKGSLKAKSSSVMWTYLLHRVLGYDYVDDSLGIGIIHDNEPVQAVFFGRNVVDVVERFVNPDKKKVIIEPREVFAGALSPVEFLRTDQQTIDAALRILLTYATPSNVIPSKFMGMIHTNSNKLKAKLILRDLRMYKYFKDIDANLQKTLDNYIIKRIRGLNSNTIINQVYSGIIWDYFELIKDHNWPQGERELLSVMRELADYDEAKLINDTFENNVLGIRWSEGNRLLSAMRDSSNTD